MSEMAGPKWFREMSHKEGGAVPVEVGRSTKKGFDLTNAHLGKIYRAEV